ncbi:Scramblase like protein, partial [Aduncisulcus paluster]
MTDADNFAIQFPPQSTYKDRAVLLGATMLIDFLYFERADQSAGAEMSMGVGNIGTFRIGLGVVQLLFALFIPPPPPPISLLPPVPLTSLPSISCLLFSLALLIDML